MLKHSVLLLALVAMSGCAVSPQTQSSQPTTIYLTQSQADDALHSIRKLSDGNYECRVEFETVVMYVTVYPNVIDKFKTELKHKVMTNIQNADSNNGGGSESSLSFGGNGPGVSTGNGFQMDLKDGRISPSWSK